MPNAAPMPNCLANSDKLEVDPEINPSIAVPAPFAISK